MKKENILLLAASGFIVANLFTKTIEKHARLSPRKVLFDIKKELKKDKGFYDGWIEHKTVPFKKFALTHDAYPRRYPKERKCQACMLRILGRL